MRKIKRIRFNDNIEFPERSSGTDLIWFDRPPFDHYEPEVDDFFVHFLTDKVREEGISVPLIMIKQIDYEDVKDERDEKKEDRPVKRDTKRPKAKVRKTKV